MEELNGWNHESDIEIDIQSEENNQAVENVDDDDLDDQD